MKNQPFHYTVLKYRPNYLLDEQINIGLLFVFPSEKSAKFLFPTNLSRLKTLFPKANIGFIRQYLDAFQWKANSLKSNFRKIEIDQWLSSKEKPLEEYINPHDLDDKSLNKILADNFVVPDATSFYFSDWKSGEHHDFPALLEYYRNLYFSVFEMEEVGRFVEVE
jgi:Protein of unknown function (DUF3037)